MKNSVPEFTLPIDYELYVCMDEEKDLRPAMSWENRGWITEKQRDDFLYSLKRGRFLSACASTQEEFDEIGLLNDYIEKFDAYIDECFEIEDAKQAANLH